MSSTESSASSTSGPSDVFTVEKYATLSRLYNYSLVHGTVDRTFNIYNYAKQYALLKKPLEMTESVVTTVGKPILDKFDPLLQSVDQFGVKKLDQIENTVSRANEGTKDIIRNTISTADGVLDRVLEYSSEKIQGTQVNDLVQKTVGMADSVVDTVLPPPSDEDLENETEMYQLEKRCRLFLKLRKRINKESLMKVPGNTYNGVVLVSKSKPLSATTQMIQDTIQKIQEMTFKTGGLVPTETIYNSLDTLAASVGSFAIWIRRFDPNEVLISITELTKMIKDSKENVIKMNDASEQFQKLKEDTIAIMSKLVEILQEQLSTGLAKYEDLKKTDSVVLKQTVFVIENTIRTIYSICKDFIPNRLLTQSSSSSQQQQQKPEASSSSSTPAQESTSSPPSPSSN